MEQRKYERLEEIIQHERMSAQHKPFVSPASHKILELKAARGENSSSFVRKPLTEEEHQFKPTISKKSKQIERTVPIEILLTADAKRRAVNKMSRSMAELPTSDNKLGKHSEKLIYQRFSDDFTEMMTELNVSAEKQVDLALFRHALSRLGFIGLENQNAPLVDQLWEET